MELGRSVVPGGHLKHSVLLASVVSDGGQGVHDDWPEPCAMVFGTEHRVHGAVAEVPTLMVPGKHFVQKGFMPWVREDPAGQPHSASLSPYLTTVASKLGFVEL